MEGEVGGWMDGWMDGPSYVNRNQHIYLNIILPEMGGAIYLAGQVLGGREHGIFIFGLENKAYVIGYLIDDIFSV